VDIDFIRVLWEAGDVVYSEESQDRLWQREVTIENIGDAIRTGRIVEEREGHPYRKCTIHGWTNRKVADLEIGLHTLKVACAVGEELHIITVYWE
jgi:hypothetical protein